MHRVLLLDGRCAIVQLTVESQTPYDALIIGGGPGGSTAATLLARAGRRVLLLEKEVFPRFHIGESLLPYNLRIFEELGVLPTLEQAGLIRKWGAQFHLGDGSKSLCLVFRNGRFTRETMAYQVERAAFDHVLLKHARASGAEVREGWTVTRADNTSTAAQLQARGPDGVKQVFTGSFLIDASGRANLTGNQEGLRVVHPRLRKVAVFGHFSNVALDSGETGGDTVIVRLENKWFWVIPLSAEKVSVGCVMDQDELVRSKEAPEQVFQRLWRGSPALHERMKEAKLIGPMHTTSDFSYHNRRLTGPRLLRVGDAAGFMDPIFSSGVFLAMHTGRLAAEVVHDSLRGGEGSNRRLQRYEKEVSRAMRLYWRMVEGFYTLSFFEVFMEPRPRFDLPAAVTAILAGELGGGWALRWRLGLFFLLTRVQAHWAFLPRIRWTSTAGERSGRSTACECGQ